MSIGPNRSDLSAQSLPSKAQIMRAAQSYLPINQLQLPEGYYRADLIDPSTIYKGTQPPLTPQELQQLTNSSSLEEALSNYTATHSQEAQNVSRNQRKPGDQRHEDISVDKVGQLERQQTDARGGQGGEPSPDSQERPTAARLQTELPEGDIVKDITHNDQQTTTISEDYRIPQLILNHAALQKAYSPLSYDEGYPMTDEGQPFWQKLPCEPIDAYIAFQAYIEQGTQGNRQIFTLANSTHMQQRIAASRAQHTHQTKLHEQQSGTSWLPNVQPGGRSDRAEYMGPLEGSGFIPSDTNGNQIEIINSATHDEIVEWFYLYHWDFRAKSHDLFYIDSIRKSREMLALTLQNTHFTDSQKLYSKLLAFINPDRSDPNFKPYFLDDDDEPRFWKELTPKTALEALKLTTQLQRVSIGLHPTSITPNHTLQENVKYLASRSPSLSPKSTTGKSVRGEEDARGPNPENNREQLSAADRSRRLAILLDKARSRKAGNE
jgi:hypothetical protein